MSSYPYMWAALHAEHAIDDLRCLDRYLAQAYPARLCPGDLARLWTQAQQAAQQLRRVLDELENAIALDVRRHEEGR